MRLKGSILKQAGNEAGRCGPLRQCCSLSCCLSCGPLRFREPPSTEDDTRGRVAFCVSVGEPAEEGRVERGEEEA